MNRLRTLIAWLWLALGAAPLAPGAASNSVAKSAVTARYDLDSFRIIADRNIFDPTRSAPGAPRTRNRDNERRVRTQSFSLLGTMSYEKGRFAFFDGSSSEYRKVLQPDGSIAGFKVTSVAPTCVRLLTTNGQNIELCVGMQMTKREDDDWQVSERSSSSSSSSSSSASASSASDSSSGGDDDVAKRLMQRREQDEGGAPAKAASAAAAPATNSADSPPAAATESKAPAAAGAGEPDDALKRLLQKREQELTK